MADPKIPPHMNPMTVDEVTDMLSATLHGPLPRDTMYRVYATLAAWAPIVKGNLPGSSVVATESLYAIFRDHLLENGLEIDPWDQLEARERLAWDAVVEHMSEGESD